MTHNVLLNFSKQKTAFAKEKSVSATKQMRPVK